MTTSTDLSQMVTFSFSSGRRIYRGHSASVSGVSFFPDPNFFISSSEDKSLRLWNVDQASDVAVYKGHNYQVVALVCCLKVFIILSNFASGQEITKASCQKR